MINFRLQVSPNVRRSVSLMVANLPREHLKYFGMQSQRDMPALLTPPSVTRRASHAENDISKEGLDSRGIPQISTYSSFAKPVTPQYHQGAEVPKENCTKLKDLVPVVAIGACLSDAFINDFFPHKLYYT